MMKNYKALKGALSEISETLCKTDDGRRMAEDPLYERDERRSVADH